MGQLLVAGLALASLTGCYILRQACGQLHILSNRQNVEKVQGTPEEKRKIALILEVKAFGERVIGLKPTDNYTTYFDTRGKPVSYTVTASRKDRFHPYTWTFPIIGTVPYKGFFDRKDAIAEAKELEAMGLDVSFGTVSAYSTLGWFSDPIFSSMLDQDDEELADLILHELTHSTLYVNGQGDFNESMASFVGRQGSLEFIERRWGTGSPIHRRALARFADEDKIDEFMQGLFLELDSFYRIAPPEAVVGRAAIWKRAQDRFREVRKDLRVLSYDWILKAEVNNAILLGRRRYGRTALFRKHFEQGGGDWAKFFDKMRILGRQPDPIKALEE